MFKRILVPLDGSLRAEQALPVAARLAREARGVVVIAQVVRIPTEYGMYSVTPISVTPALIDADRTEAELYLSHVKGHESLAGLRVETDVIVGQPARDILDEISSKNVDFVVMSSHGRTGLARWALGSVAEYVARYASVPILIVKENSAPLTVSPRDDRQPRVLVPLDGSPLAESAIEPAVSLAMAFGAGVHLALVVMPIEAIRENMPEALVVDGAKGYLSNVAHRLTAEHQGLRVSWTVGVDMDTATAIIRIVEGGEDTEGAGVSGGCDVIAMATHGRTGLNRWALGSITERVLHGSHHAMLIVRARHENDSLHTEERPSHALFDSVARS